MKIQFERPPLAGTGSDGLAVHYAASRRQVPRWRWILLLSIVLAPLLFLVVRLGLALLWDTVPAVVVMPQVALRAGNAGVVEQVLPEGSAVTEGTRLLVLQRAPLTPPVAEAAPAAVGIAALAAVDGRAAAQRAAAAQSALALAEQAEQWRQQRRQALSALVSRGAATTAEHDAAIGAWVAAQADVVRARADLAAAQVAVQRLIAQGQVPLAAARSSAAAMPVEDVGPRAPFDGTVKSVLVRRHEWVAADTEVLVLQGHDTPIVRAFVSPDSGQHAQRGAKATLIFPDRSTLRATVTAIDSEVGRLPSERVGPLSARSQTIVVTLKLEDPLPERYRIHNLPLDARFSRF